jgi:hypothetical protein
MNKCDSRANARTGCGSLPRQSRMLHPRLTTICSESYERGTADSLSSNLERNQIHSRGVPSPVSFSTLLRIALPLLAWTLNVRAAPDFGKEIYPILKRSCLECHNSTEHKGGLRLDSAEGALDDPSILSLKKPIESELLRRITLPKEHEEVMPNRGESLSQRDVRLLREWIEAGAPWPDPFAAPQHWSLTRIERPPVPAGAPHPVDAFVRDRLAREGLTPSPEAEKHTLLRRLHLDLTGIPPTLEETECFVADTTPEAYEKTVDRLLQSDQFGVKWARQWLDAARYADSHGFQRDDLRELWPYRDWVVAALNADMPFDRFTIEQLAGDLLPNPTLEQRVATGFNRSAPTNVEAGSDPEETRVNQVIDRVNTLGTVWLGSTLECAQCHDHKYDAFSQKDYYGLFAFFNNTSLEADRTSPKAPGSIQFKGPYLRLPAAEYEQKAKKVEPTIETEKNSNSSNNKAVPRRLRKEPEDTNQHTTLIMQEDSPRMTTVFHRGDFRNPGAAVTPMVPAILHPLKSESSPPNRLDLARWLTDRENPLTARVTVNRWWGEIFGNGLVSTPEDFGVKGEPPTHPELLDWLASELFERGWSMKQLLRTILTSQTYKQRSDMPPVLRERDDRNLLLARGPRFRLDAELIRDNALAIGGLLNPRLKGEPIRPPQPPGWWNKVGGKQYVYETSPGEEQYRRGLFVVLKRGSPYPSLVNFDANARMACRVKRTRSNTPLQALTLLNDPVYVDAANAFAERIRSSAGSEAERIATGFRLALGRPPAAVEKEALLALFDSLRDDPAEPAAQPITTPAAAGDSKSTPRAANAAAVSTQAAQAELAAWRAVATTLLNLDETISKP